MLIDHIWAWRADHGRRASAGRPTPADTGVVVNGDDVTATGLFVEHFQQYNIIWNGEDGKTILFQNELPYDPPNQAAWRHDGVLGWAALQGRDPGAGPTSCGASAATASSTSIPTIHATRAFEVPVTPRREAARHPDRLDHEQRHDRPRRERVRPADARRHVAGQHRLVPVAPACARTGARRSGPGPPA